MPLSREEWGRRVKAAREAAQHTQESFAPQLGVSSITLSRYELGKSLPSPDRAALIHELLGVEPPDRRPQSTLGALSRRVDEIYELAVATSETVIRLEQAVAARPAEEPDARGDALVRQLRDLVREMTSQAEAVEAAPEAPASRRAEGSGQ